MTLNEKEMKVLELISEDCRITPDKAALLLGLPEEFITETIKKLEAEKVIVGYPALINWDKTPVEKVKAIIEVRVTPQRDMGFDAIAERIYKFDEVTAVYLMSGAYDLLLEVQAETLRTLATFVSQKLSTLDSVLSTATHFVLKKYKVDGVILEDKKEDDRLAVT